jgi:hypothetical protein
MLAVSLAGRELISFSSWTTGRPTKESFRSAGLEGAGRQEGAAEDQGQCA